MRTGAHGTSKMAYRVTLAMLMLALAFPIGLMVFNPTLMFARGWEQYVGTAIYFWAVLTLGRELWTLWRNEPWGSLSTPTGAWPPRARFCPSCWQSCSARGPRRPLHCGYVRVCP